MVGERHVRLFRNGRNQAVRIPREFELPGEDAIIRKEGDRLVIEPTPPRSLLAVLASLDPIEEEFPAIDELPHAAIGHAPDDPIGHMLVREEKGIRPGGFGLLMVRNSVDELIYNEKRNEVVFVKYLGDGAAKGGTERRSRKGRIKES